MSTYRLNRMLKIKELMRQVNVTEMCRRAGVKRRVYYAVIDGESSDINSLAAVVKEARKEIRWMKKNKGASRQYNRQPQSQ